MRKKETTQEHWICIENRFEMTKYQHYPQGLAL